MAFPWQCVHTDVVLMSTFTGMGLTVTSYIILLSHHNASLIANTCH